jgi:hypothetical protein
MELNVPCVCSPGTSSFIDQCGDVCANGRLCGDWTLSGVGGELCPEEFFCVNNVKRPCLPTAVKEGFYCFKGSEKGAGSPCPVDDGALRCLLRL